VIAKPPPVCGSQESRREGFPFSFVPDAFIVLSCFYFPTGQKLRVFIVSKYCYSSSNFDGKNKAKNQHIAKIEILLLLFLK
jgi:hypothetical protein